MYKGGLGNYSIKLATPNLKINNVNKVIYSSNNCTTSIDNMQYDTIDYSVSCNSIKNISTTVTAPRIFNYSTSAMQNSTLSGGLVSYTEYYSIGVKEIISYFEPSTEDDFNRESKAITKSFFSTAKGVGKLEKTIYKVENSIYEVNSSYYGDRYSILMLDKYISEREAALQDDPEKLREFRENECSYKGQEKIAKEWVAFYKGKETQYNDCLKRWDALTKEMEHDFNRVLSEGEELSLRQKYTEEFTKLKEEMNECKEYIVGPEGVSDFEFDKFLELVKQN